MPYAGPTAPVRMSATIAASSLSRSPAVKIGSFVMVRCEVLIGVKGDAFVPPRKMTHMLRVAGAEMKTMRSEYRAASSRKHACRRGACA